MSNATGGQVGGICADLLTEVGGRRGGWIASDLHMTRRGIDPEVVFRFKSRNFDREKP
jgi:hypothetical protein